MAGLLPYVLAHAPEIRRIVAASGASNPRIFGSVARGDDGPESDFDILVDYLPGFSLIQLSGLQIDLRELLGRWVDVVVEEGIPEGKRPNILRDAIAL
jgi:uncharacterized protein